MKLSRIALALGAPALLLTGLAFLPGSPVLAQESIKSIPLPTPAREAAAARQGPSTEALAWVQKHAGAWPEKTRRLAAQLITRYGPPAEATDRRLTWYGNGPWKRTALYREEVQHNFANPHKDILEQTISYRVPPEKLAALLAFNGSLVVNRTRGELSSISDAEDTNFLALNVADDLIRGERDADQARTYYAQIVRAKMIKEPEADLQALQFKAAPDTADADEVAPLIRHMTGGSE